MKPLSALGKCRAAGFVEHEVKALKQRLQPLQQRRARLRGRYAAGRAMKQSRADPILQRALQGLGDTLAREVAPFGIRVTSVQPGVYRSDWGGRSQSTSERQVAGYEWVFDPARTAGITWGDSQALGNVVATAIDAEEPPLHLLVGPTALSMVRKYLASFSAEIDRWEKLSMADGEG
jgi:NAD(P)-dependent dehydrogenase (short-subunit alcohol dehydrogenase family)